LSARSNSKARLVFAEQLRFRIIWLSAKTAALGDIRRDAPAKLIHGKLVDAKPAGD
jgi:hypothetical protein